MWNADCWATAEEACVKLRWLFSDTFKSATARLHHYTDFNDKNATCLIRHVMALILKYGCIIWFKMQWQIQLPLPKIQSLQWSKSPPVKNSLGGAECSYEGSLETDTTSKLLWSTERRSCDTKDIKAYNQKSLGNETRWRRHKRGTENKPVTSKKNRKTEEAEKGNKIDKLGTDYGVYLITTADVSVEKPSQ